MYGDFWHPVVIDSWLLRFKWGIFLLSDVWAAPQCQVLCKGLITDSDDYCNFETWGSGTKLSIVNQNWFILHNNHNLFSKHIQWNMNYINLKNTVKKLTIKRQVLFRETAGAFGTVCNRARAITQIHTPCLKCTC